MKDLVADAGYIHGLATTQRDAARDTRTAVTRTAGLPTEVWKTHGIYTWFGNEAIALAVEAVETASEAMANLSERLAAELDAAAKIYTGVDEGLGQGLDTQMGI